MLAVAFLAGDDLAVLRPTCAKAAGGTYQKLEAAFELPQVQGNPFDFMQNDVKVSFAGPDGSEATLPAFFDGGQTWRVRDTPTAPGRYTIRAVTLNGQDARPRNLQPSEFEVTGRPRPGFVRLDPRTTSGSFWMMGRLLSNRLRPRLARDEHTAPG